MAKNSKKNQTPEIETTEVTEAIAEVAPVAPVEPLGAAARLTAITDLDELDKAYKAMRKELKGEAANANKAAAIDLVTDAADELIDEMIAAVSERGMRFTNFTVRYVSKSDTGSGYGEDRGIKTIIGAVRMTADEIKERDESNAAEYGIILAEADDENLDELTGWIEAHPSFTFPVVEETPAE